jgi:predicted O-linked N-acetylglucosamine transferase (SPINDLY family)
MAYDAFAVGLPIVTLPGAYAVGRWTLGCYLRMGLGQLVADSPEDYIRRAVHLGTELEHRRAVQATLIERGDVLLEDPQCLHEHERFFDEALASPK